MEKQYTAGDLAAAMVSLYERGLTSASGGNISVLGKNGDILITPSGVDKGALEAKHIIRVHADGSYDSAFAPSVELPFHRTAYSCGADIRVVVHAHPPEVVALSATRKLPDLRAFPALARYGRNIAIVPYAIPGSSELGDLIADKLRAGARITILYNHGLVCTAPTLAEAMASVEAVTTVCRAQIGAGVFGGLRYPDRELAPEWWMPLPGSGRPAQDFDDDDKREMLRRYGRRLARMGHCGAHLGEISLRIGPDAFLTHRDSAFRPALNPTDLVVVQAGKVSGSAAVGPMARIHEAIYQAHDWVNGMITAAPDYLLGLCAAHRRLDTHVIPESYMVLDDVPMLPVSSLQDPQAIAARITRENTVLMIENVGIIVASASLYKAFDKMEVARYTAQAVQQAQLLGGVVPIEQEEIGKIRSFFGVHS